MHALQCSGLTDSQKLTDGKTKKVACLCIIHKQTTITTNIQHLPKVRVILSLMCSPRRHLLSDDWLYVDNCNQLKKALYLQTHKTLSLTFVELCFFFIDWCSINVLYFTEHDKSNQHDKIVYKYHKNSQQPHVVHFHL